MPSRKRTTTARSLARPPKSRSKSKSQSRAKSSRDVPAKLAISSPDKILYPGGKFTKADVVNYYRQVARFLLPHFRGRPVTLKRFPNGVFGDAFYEKNAPGFTPAWVKTFPVPRHEPGPPIDYVLINDLQTLLWAANIAALELHPFLHRVPQIDVPTHVVFDLDPGEGTNILHCARVALRLRDVLGKLRLKSFAKVSGSKGIQVYIPLNTAVTYDSTQPFARAVAELMEKNHPNEIVADMAKNLRVGKVFIDWSQNADHKTTVGVYSLRAKRPRPYVSMPVTWLELTLALKKSDATKLEFGPPEAIERLKRSGDLFAPVLKLKQKLPSVFVSSDRSRRSKAARSGPARDRRKEATPTALREYDAKRNFSRTNEPAPDVPARSRQGSRRRFVVQKHAASHLHYDFRLEMHDVLKSWAVPKGIPLTQDQTHTGFQTEDHPIEYLDFEGTIPRGEYGGGTVMVWDIGTYEIIEGNYWKGFVSVYLTGKKLKGPWSLQRLEGGQDDKTKWLIRKIERNAKPITGKQDDASALTGRTMEQIAGDKKSAVWRTHAASTRSNAGNTDATTTAPSRAERRGSHGKTGLPPFVRPMKATGVAELPSGNDWIYEVKWDGYRILGGKSGESVRLLSLKEKNLTGDFPAVADALKTVRADSVLIDGEVVAIDSQGCPSFQALQNRASTGGKWQIVYYAFDLLSLDGKSWTMKPLHERKTKLREVLEGSDVRYNAELSGSPAAIARTVEEAGLEGVIAKKRDSLYRAGSRVTTWLKYKIDKAQEFVIGGYKPDAGSFQSILAGYYEGRKLIFAGKVRQGFNPASRQRLLKEMKPCLTKQSPFANLPTSRKSHFGEGITADEMAGLCWLKPKLVAQVSFTEWTDYGLLRHATFKGLRDDKSAHQVVREISN